MHSFTPYAPCYRFNLTIGHWRARGLRLAPLRPGAGALLTPTCAQGRRRLGAGVLINCHVHILVCAHLLHEVGQLREP